MACGTVERYGYDNEKNRTVNKRRRLQGLNAALHGVAKALYEYYDKDVELYGLRDGYRGLIEGDYRLMNREDFSGILCLGGTILGTSRQPFKLMRVVDENSVDKVKAMKATYKKLKLDCLVILGGNGTHKTANLLREEGLNVVTMPKTIDNDLWGTDKTFGFQSAVNIATNVLDCIHTTATSHGRVFIVELMGHKAGWLTLEAGIAGGADIILIPEIPMKTNILSAPLRKETPRQAVLYSGRGGGSHLQGGFPFNEKGTEAKLANRKYPSISYQLAEELQTALGQEVRVTVPGHFQRGGSPCPFDRTLATRLGAAAAQLVINKNYGNMVALRGTDIVPVPLREVAGKLKVVPKDSDIVQAARQIGVSFGDC